MGEPAVRLEKGWLEEREEWEGGEKRSWSDSVRPVPERARRKRKRQLFWVFRV